MRQCRELPGIILPLDFTGTCERANHFYYQNVNIAAFQGEKRNAAIFVIDKEQSIMYVI